LKVDELELEEKEDYGIDIWKGCGVTVRVGKTAFNQSLSDYTGDSQWCGVQLT